MATSQVWLRDIEREMLKFLIEFFEQQQDEDFGGKSFQWMMREGKRARRKRERMNKNYVIRFAIQELYRDIKGFADRKAIERKNRARHMSVRRGSNDRNGNNSSQSNDRLKNGDCHERYDILGRFSVSARFIMRVNQFIMM